MEKICIIGAGGHAQVVFDSLQKAKVYEVSCFFAKNINGEKEFLGIPFFEQDQLFDNEINSGVVAIGDNWIRSRVVELIKKNKPNFKFISVVHPSTSIAQTAKIGKGSVVMPGSVVGPQSVIGEHCIVNTSSSIDHDCKIDDFASVAPGAILGGNVKVGRFSAISLGANIIHGIQIGEHTVIGAGSTVIKDIGSYKVALGVPCRVVKERVEGKSYL